MNQLDPGLQTLLQAKGLHQARRLACLVPRKLAGDALSQRLGVLLDGLGAGDRSGRWAPQLLQLLQAARGEAPELAD